ncbi:endonuclease domain-containing protein [Sphingobium algorifonticola]|uniref:Endonuclease domain-containing protein n=1 Tax=Sphingobium algorifonticola TaxID=2008318 RepID=A0A437J8F2_9SPHN|nr:endonuclease domain-containing protein [Sphingobium algorifonticola]RVT41774.1 endonuclease domain-containing protein [Sphingobium algorifonticola]
MRLDPELKERAKHMRANPTPAEQKLWLALRANRFENQQFTRQTIIAPYIVDFASKADRLIIEVDGDTHSAEDRYDARRTEFLESLGYRVIRFANHDVLDNLEGVLGAIAQALRASPSPQPSPHRGREQK